MGVTDTSAAKKCAECGKEFVVLYQDIWAYKRGEKWLCSWKCLRAYDKSKEGSPLRKVTLEDKKKAVEIAISGGDPREYLGKLCKAPDAMWSSIRKALKDSDPEMFAKLPRSIKGAKKEAPETHKEEETEEMDEDFFPAGEDVKTPERPQIWKPVNYDGFEMMSIKSTDTGNRYEWSSEYDLFAIKSHGDEMTLSLEDMRKLYRELPRAALVLGVEL